TRVCRRPSSTGWRGFSPPATTSWAWPTSSRPSARSTSGATKRETTSPARNPRSGSTAGASWLALPRHALDPQAPHHAGKDVLDLTVVPLGSDEQGIDDVIVRDLPGEDRHTLVLARHLG